MNQLPQESNQVIEVSLKWLEVLSLFTGIASLVLAIVAIWLSYKFFQLSTASSDKINESSTKINNNVEKLEKMFDTMYADTFGMVKETVSHMRLQADRHNGVDVSRDIEKEIDKKIKDHLDEITADKITKDEVENMMKNIVKESKEIEFELQKNEIERRIIDELRSGGKSFDTLLKKIFRKSPSSKEYKLFYKVIKDLAHTGIISNVFGVSHEDVEFVYHDELIFLLREITI